MRSSLITEVDTMRIPNPPPNVSKADNELHIYAAKLNWSSEISLAKGGPTFKPYSFILNGVLPTNSPPKTPPPHLPYALVFVGINWDGPWAFEVGLYGPKGRRLYHFTPSGTGKVGLVWHQTVPIYVN